MEIDAARLPSQPSCRQRLCLGTALLLLGLPQQGVAQRPPSTPAQPVAQAEPAAGSPTFNLRQVAVQGSPFVEEADRLTTEEPVVRLPRLVFDRQPSDRASDILPRLPGVVVTGPPGEQKAFGLRGLTSDYTRVQINGLSLPSGAQTRAFELMNVPGFLLDEVAILHNPGAETESDGIGGRIALRLRAQPAIDATELRFAAGGNDRLFDGRHFTSSGLLARRFDGGFGFVGGYSLDQRTITKVKDFSEYTYQGGPGGAGTIVDQLEPKDFRNLDAFLQLGWDWGSGQLTLRPFIFDEAVDAGNRRDTYRRLTGQLNTRVYGDGEEHTRVGGLALGLRQALTGQLTLEADAAVSLARFDSTSDSRTYAASGAFTEGSRESSHIADDQYDLALRLAWRPEALPGHELRTGVQARRLSRTSDAETATLLAGGVISQTAADLRRSREADYEAAETYGAVFVQDRITLGRLTLSPGLRLETVAYDLDGVLGSYTPQRTELLPSLPALLRLTETLSLRAAIGRRVNRPTLQELAPGLTIRGNRSYYGNPELEPSLAWAFDVGLDYATRHLFLSVAAFHREMTDVVEAQEFATNQFRYANVGDGRVRGLEFEQRINAALFGGSALAPLTFRLNQTFLDSRVDDPATGPRRFSEVPRFAGNVGVEWNDEARGTTFAANLNHISTRQIRSYNGAGSYLYKEINPTNILDLRLEQRLAPGVSVYGTAQNLLNQERDEWEQTNGVLSRTATIATGRVFFLGIRLQL